MDHLEAEFAADVDEAMHTLVAAPVFRFWCGYRDADGPTALPGPVIRANYERVFAHGFPAIEIRPDRLLVSDDGIAIEGEQHSVLDGVQLRARGIDVDDAGRFHVVCRFALVIEFVDDLMVGEDHYWPLPFSVTELGVA